LLLALLIVTTVFNVGCVSSLTPTADGGAAVAIADAPAGGGLQQVSDGGKIAAYALVGLAITFCFALDLLILAATHRDPFPCSRAVISCCR